MGIKEQKEKEYYDWLSKFKKGDDMGDGFDFVSVDGRAVTVLDRADNYNSPNMGGVKMTFIPMFDEKGNIW